MNHRKCIEYCRDMYDSIVVVVWQYRDVLDEVQIRKKMSTLMQRIKIRCYENVSCN
jgi:hypothetical protein